MARALGYSLGLAYLRKHDDGRDGPTLVLPANFFSPGQTEAAVAPAEADEVAEE